MSESKIQIQRWVIPVVAGLAAVILIGGLIYFYQAKNKPQIAPTKVDSLSHDAKPTVAGGPGTDKYNRELQQFETEAALKAAKAGESRAAVPVGKVSPIENNDLIEQEEEKKPEPPPKQSAPVAAEVKAAERERAKQLAEMQKSVNGAIISEMQMINTALEKNTPEPTVFVYAAAAVTKTEDGEKQNNNSSGDANPKPAAVTPFEVGEVLYAMNSLSINSDVPGPVMIELVSGRLRGGKFIGSFARHNKFLLLKFTAFAYEGKTYPVEALAVDPNTSGVAVRSDVDSHYIERWGGLVAASFLEGFAEAVGNSGQSAETVDSTVIVNHPVYSAADQMWIAAGKVGERLAEPMLQNFYRAPTVYLEPGTEMGILIIKN